MNTIHCSLRAAFNAGVSRRDLESRLVALDDAAKLIANSATASGRPISAEEDAQIAQIHSAFRAVEDQLERIEDDPSPTPGRRLTRPGPVPISAHADPEIAATPRPLTRSTGTGARAASSPLLNQFRNSEAFRLFQNGSTRDATIPFEGMSLRGIRNALTSTQTATSPNQGFDVLPGRYNVVGEDPRRKLSILDVLAHYPCASNQVEHHLLDQYQNAAAIQAYEGATKATAEVPLTIRSAQVATIAHVLKASTSVLADAPMLNNWLSSLLAFGCLSKLEQECIAGTGTISGLLTQAQTYVPTETTAADQIAQAGAELDARG